MRLHKLTAVVNMQSPLIILLARQVAIAPSAQNSASSTNRSMYVIMYIYLQAIEVHMWFNVLAVPFLSVSRSSI